MSSRSKAQEENLENILRGCCNDLGEMSWISVRAMEVVRKKLIFGRSATGFANGWDTASKK